MKIVFFGTPEFAAPILETLISRTDMEVIAVITQPDKKIGRKQVITPPIIKTIAIKHHITVFQPKNHQELKDATSSLNPDFFVVVAYGMILKQEILDMPKYASVNVHPSLLPELRGAAPIQNTLLQGKKETGTTIMKMEQSMDSGPIYLSQRINIEEKETSETLSKKLSLLSSQLLPEVLIDISEGLTPIPQDHSKATYCKKIEKSDGQIKEDQSAQDILNMLKAYTPWPGVHFRTKDKKIKILQAEISSKNVPSGKLIEDQKDLLLGTPEKALKINELQLEGKKTTDSQSFLNGYKNLLD